MTQRDTLERLADEELYREYYHPRDKFRRPLETERLRDEIRRRVDAAKEAKE